MKKFTLLVLFSCLLGQFIDAQSFGDYHVLANGKINALRAFATFDSDNDGDIDIIASSKNRKMYFFENIGGASFRPIQELDLSFAEPEDILAIDVDNDGFTDIVYADDFMTSKLRWIKNRGNNTFKHEYPLIEDFTYIDKLEKHDFNGDGFEDIILNTSSDSLYLAIIENSGDGSFAKVDTLVVNKYMSYYQCIDIDNDADLDIVYNEDNSIFYLINEGDFNFSSPNLVIEINPPHFVNAFCFDSDNDSDLDIYVSLAFNINQLYINNGNFEFSDTVYFGSQSPQIIKAVDFDHDSDLDLIISGIPMIIYENLGNNNFDSLAGLPQWLEVSNMNIYDVDNDQLEDIMVEFDNCGMMGWLKNEEQSPFSKFTSLTSQIPRVNSIGVGFVNNDDYPDICVNDDYYRTTFFLNDGKGEFNDTLTTAKLHRYSESVYFEDFNNDGFCDVLSYDSYYPYGEDSILFKFSKNLKNNSFEKINVDNFIDERRGVKFSDYDGDSKIDIILCNSMAELDTIYFLKPKTDFTIEVVDSLFLNSVISCDKMEFHDIDGNGEQDMLIFDERGLAIPNYILISYSDNGKFSPVIDTLFTVDNSIYGWCFADLHGTGKSDFLASLKNGTKILVIEDIANTKSPSYELSLDNWAFNLFNIDMNNDGKDEVVYSESYPDRLVLMSDVSEFDTKFSDYLYYGVSSNFSSPNQIKYDLDTDGDLDYLSCNYYNSNLSWFENDYIHAYVNENSLGEPLNIYPNPASGNIINLDLGADNEGPSEVFVYSSVGSLIKIYHIPNNRKTLDINITDFVPGVYYLRVNTKMGIKSSKFVVIN